MLAQINSKGYDAGDYLHCIDCGETFAFKKYGSLTDTNHDGHKIRALRPEDVRMLAWLSEDDDAEEE